MSTAAFPSELVGRVIDEVESHTDLYRLSLISCDFNYWAERRLYRRQLRIRLPMMEKLIISLATWPRLAAHVTDIELSAWKKPDNSVIRSIKQAFQSTINLTSLTIDIHWLLCVIDSDMTFRLKSFAYSYSRGRVNFETSRKLVAFWAAQVHLECLKSASNIFTDSGVLLPPQVLPRLTALDALIDTVTFFLTGRSISHLAVRTIRTLENTYVNLADVSTVRSLCIGEEAWLPLYRGCFLKLRFLQVRKARSGKRIPYLEEMPVLEKIKSYDYIAWSGTITQSFAVCPSLQRIEIQIVDAWRLGSKTWVRDGEILDSWWQADEWMYA